MSPVRLPQRFDLIYASDLDKTHPQTNIGYLVDIRELASKSSKVLTNNGTPAYTPKNYTIKFLNQESKVFTENDILKHIQSGVFTFIEPKGSPTLDIPKYKVGDLLFNNRNKKISLIVGIMDTNENADLTTKLHSQFWYKTQSPGQQWFPLSETFIDHGLEQDKFFELHNKK